MRKAVTGSSKKRVRDHIREQQDEPKVLKFVDKLAFVIGKYLHPSAIYIIHIYIYIYVPATCARMLLMMW